jgi:hypothetical protein
MQFYPIFNLTCGLDSMLFVLWSIRMKFATYFNNSDSSGLRHIFEAMETEGFSVRHGIELGHARTLAFRMVRTNFFRSNYSDIGDLPTHARNIDLNVLCDTMLMSTTAAPSTWRSDPVNAVLSAQLSHRMHTVEQPVPPSTTFAIHLRCSRLQCQHHKHSQQVASALALWPLPRAVHGRHHHDQSSCSLQSAVDHAMSDLRLRVRCCSRQRLGEDAGHAVLVIEPVVIVCSFDRGDVSGDPTKLTRRIPIDSIAAGFHLNGVQYSLHALIYYLHGGTRCGHYTAELLVHNNKDSSRSVWHYYDNLSFNGRTEPVRDGPLFASPKDTARGQQLHLLHLAFFTRVSAT